MLKELRVALICWLTFVMIFFFLCYHNRIPIYQVITKPITSIFKKEYNSLFIYTSIFESFMTDITLSFYTAIFLSLPILLICIYWFIQKSLYPHEKKILSCSLLFVLILTILSAMIVYYFLLPNFIQFFMFGANVATPMLKISEYISTFFHLIFIIALVFQFPILLPLFVKFGFIKNDFLKKNRKMAIVIIFIISAIITPPDIFSQITIASILIALYEITNHFLLKCNTKPKKKSHLTNKTKLS